MKALEIDAQRATDSSTSSPIEFSPYLFVKSTLDWVHFIILLEVKDMKNGDIIALCGGFTVFAVSGIGYRFGYVKIFPKIWNVVLLVINSVMVVYELAASPSTSWIQTWSPLIVSISIAAFIAVTLALGRPFCHDFAKEKVSEDQWSSSIVMHTSYVISYVWMIVLVLDVLFDVLRLYISGKANIALDVIQWALFISALVFSYAYPEYQRKQRLADLQKQ